MMIVAVSRIPLPKTERYLYWVRVANKNLVVNTITRFLLFIFSCRKVLIIQGFYTPFVKKVLF